MYIVRYGETCVRYTGMDWDEDDLPEWAEIYDFDDENAWTVAALKREIRNC